VRAVSTVVDTLVFLLLVSASVAALVVPAPPPTAPPADPVAGTLATTTLGVPLGPVPTGEAAAATGDPGADRAVATERVARGKPAGLLARAALANATLDGRRLLPGTLPARVEAAVDEARPVANVRVVARWRPYPNASLSGRAVAGPAPPSGATTDVAVLTVPSGAHLDRETSLAAADEGEDEGYRSLARAVADRVVARLFPPGAGRSNLAGASAERTATRYRRVAAVVGARVDAPLADGSADVARERIAVALSGHLAADLRERFDSPERAARSLTLGTVRLTVVRWR
jgi:hypothetical protein